MLVQTILKLIPQISLGLLNAIKATDGLFLIPVTLAGSLAGQRLFLKASDTKFFRLSGLLLMMGLRSALIS